MNKTNQHYIKTTQTWIREFVVKHNICPFAKREVDNDTIAYHLVIPDSPEAILQAIVNACGQLDQHTDTATSFVITPGLSASFDYYLDVLAMAEQLLIDEGYEGIYQIASFHPKYCFADSDESDLANYSNRSPYPLFHLLREDMLSNVVDKIDDPDAIPERNITYLREMEPNALVEQLANLTESNE